MLVVPYAVGLLLTARIRPLTSVDWLLGCTWLVGYFAFSALSLALKSAPARRRACYPALATYTTAATVLGALTLVASGTHLLWWTPLYAVLVSWALWLVAHRRERSLTSGVLTILASCGLMPILRFGTPQALVDAPSPQTLADLAVMVAVTGYFIGTVWHVKALIRERNDPASATRSAAYHLGFAAVVCGAVVAGWLHWGWAVWAIALLARSIIVAQYAAKRTIRPMQVGLIEIVFSGLAVVLAALG